MPCPNRSILPIIRSATSRTASTLGSVFTAPLNPTPSHGIWQTLHSPLLDPRPENRNFTASALASAAPPPPKRFSDTEKLLPEISLKGRVIVVSGAAGGLGLQATEGLLEAGAIVHGLDRYADPPREYKEVQERAHNLGTVLGYHQIDVCDTEHLNSVVGAIADQHGRLDGLLASAGIQQETPALEYKAEDANRILQVNVTGVFMTAQAAAKQMIRFGNGGSIAMIGSMSGTVANKGLVCPAYNASKAAVIQLARNLAMEWGAHGIRVNTLSPGYIMTKMVDDLFDKFPDRKSEWQNQNMLSRLSKPTDYRGASVFLLSDASSFMTGSDLRIDGGHAAW